MNLFENLQLYKKAIILNEMALPRADAIDLCISLGEKFTDHFKEIYKKGILDRDFKHHCQELQSWYDRINKIILKQSNKQLSKIQKIDWFFTHGSSLDEIFNNTEIETKYEEFIMKLLANDDLIINILKETLK